MRPGGRSVYMVCRALPMYLGLVIKHGQNGRHLHLTSGMQVQDSIMMGLWSVSVPTEKRFAGHQTSH